MSQPSQLQTVEFTSPVGPWRLSLWTPSPDLTPAVERLWSVDAATREFQEQVVPRRTVELIVNLGEPHDLRLEDGRTVQHRRAWVSGLQTGCLHVHSRSAPRLIAASLRPAYAGRVVGARADELAEAVREWESPHLNALRERLLDTTGTAARFRRFEHYLRTRLAAPRPFDPAFAWAAEALADGAGTVRVGEINRQLGLSRKQFIQRFRQQVGLAPKRFAQVLRFDRVIAGIRMQRKVRWTEVAHQCGYYDQAHFNRDFRRFTGCTPGEFLGARDPSGQAMLVQDG